MSDGEVTTLWPSRCRTLKLWEADDDVTRGGKCSGTQTNMVHKQTLIRTACKSFHHRGSVRRELPLASFVGNILFYDAAGVVEIVYLKSDYLTNYHGTSLNRLLQSVLKDLKSPLYTAGCKDC